MTINATVEGGIVNVTFGNESAFDILLRWEGEITPPTGDEIDVLNLRLKEEALATYSIASAGTFLSTQQTDGKWPDVVYTRTVTEEWLASEHLERLIVMSVAHEKPGSSHFHSAAMKAAIGKGLDVWFANNGFPNTSTWYYTQLWGPHLMSRVLNLMEVNLTSNQLSRGITYCTTGNYEVNTGLNTVGIAESYIYVNSLNSVHNLAELQKVFTRLNKEAKISLTEEAIRQDFAFHQHGTQLQNGSYGRFFASIVARLMYLTRGLSFAFSSAALSDFSSLLLNGSQWMIRRARWDHAASGRQLSVPGFVQAGGETISAIDYMIKSGVRVGEFQSFLDHINGLNDGALVGDKHFWLGDYHAHRRVDYYVGVKLVSGRSVPHETCNGDNMQGYYLDQGAMAILRDGGEYEQIYPAWDWGRIPGVTSPHRDPAPVPTTTCASLVRGTSWYVGGVSNGVFGAAALDLNWDGITGRRSWFFFGDEVVALGVGLSGSASVPVFTSINQALKRSDVRVSYDAGLGSVVGAGEFALSSPRWIHHDNVGYVFPLTGVVKLKTAIQSGSWYEININMSQDVVSRDVFSLWFDHGMNPSQASYQYIILPSATSAQVQNYANTRKARVIENSAGRQAVRNDVLGVAAVVFYTPGSVTVRSGLTVAVDQKVAVLIDESSGAARVSVASPESVSMTARVTLSGDINKTLTFVLPSGRYAGSSVTL